MADTLSVASSLLMACVVVSVVIRRATVAHETAGLLLAGACAFAAIILRATGG